MNEAETRADHIDPALKAAGWGVVERSRIRREYEITMGRFEVRGGGMGHSTFLNKAECRLSLALSCDDV